MAWRVMKEDAVRLVLKSVSHLFPRVTLCPTGLCVCVFVPITPLSPSLIFHVVFILACFVSSPFVNNFQYVQWLLISSLREAASPPSDAARKPTPFYASWLTRVCGVR